MKTRVAKTVLMMFLSAATIAAVSSAEDKPSKPAEAVPDARNCLAARMLGKKIPECENVKLPGAPGESAEQCASSFQVRLNDAAWAIASDIKYHADYQRVMPWFYANCRILDELERATRKLDDVNAFVCKPGAKGRPRGLTQQFVDDHLENLTVQDFLEGAADDGGSRYIEDVLSCVDHDTAAHGFSLKIDDITATIFEGASDAEREAGAAHLKALRALYCATPGKCAPAPAKSGAASKAPK